MKKETRQQQQMFHQIQTGNDGEGESSWNNQPISSIYRLKLFWLDKKSSSIHTIKYKLTPSIEIVGISLMESSQVACCCYCCWCCCAGWEQLKINRRIKWMEGTGSDVLLLLICWNFVGWYCYDATVQCLTPKKKQMSAQQSVKAREGNLIQPPPPLPPPPPPPHLPRLLLPLLLSNFHQSATMFLFNPADWNWWESSSVAMIKIARIFPRIVGSDLIGDVNTLRLISSSTLLLLPPSSLLPPPSHWKGQRPVKMFQMRRKMRKKEPLLSDIPPSKELNCSGASVKIGAFRYCRPQSDHNWKSFKE